MASTSNCHMQITRVEMSAMKYQRRLNVFGTVRPLKVKVTCPKLRARTVLCSDRMFNNDEELLLVCSFIRGHLI